MMKAIWKDTVLAESNDTKIVEGNHYFPPESVNMEYLKKSGNTYTCHWKGMCDYYDIVIGDDINEDAAFIYPKPSEVAAQIKGYVSFWRGVEVKS